MPAGRRTMQKPTSFRDASCLTRPAPTGTHRNQPCKEERPVIEQLRRTATSNMSANDGFCMQRFLPGATALRPTFSGSDASRMPLQQACCVPTAPHTLKPRRLYEHQSTSRSVDDASCTAQPPTGQCTHLLLPERQIL